MARIEEAGKTVSEFLSKVLHIEEGKIKVIRTLKENGGWETEVEVYEESSFIKSLGLPTRVLDRNIYTVRLDGDLEILSYGRKEQAQLESL
ncbi:MAG: hypothetical protein HY754_10145 [Nitrospirae bacterium]|nr:hypothetical protein [Nitrospirota bacterium]